MKSILITGSTGFLGSKLTQFLNAEGYHTIGLIQDCPDREIKRTYAHISLYYKNIDELQTLLSRYKIGTIIHLATSYGLEGDECIERCNLELPMRLFKLAHEHGIQNYINADSFFSDVPKAYPYLRKYRESKIKFREGVKQHKILGQVRFINLRIFHMYGPNDKKGKFVYEIFNKVKSNIPEIDLTEGSQLRDFIYIEDVVRAFYCILNNIEEMNWGFTSHDICTGQLTSIKDFVKLIKKICSSETKLNFGALEMRDGEYYLEQLTSDNGGLIELGWKPKYNVIMGIRSMVSIEEGKENNEELKSYNQNWQTE